MGKIMGRLLILLGAASALAVAGDAVSPRLASLADAERTFAAHGAREGVQKSFLAAFADDAVVLKPFATPARAWHEAHADQPGRLIWGPQYLALGGSGELGMSSGPWRFENADGKAVAHGHFFSIWRHDASGWRVLFDNGVSHAAPADAVEATALVGLADRPAAALAPGALEQQRRALLAADDALRQRLAADPAHAYAGVTTDATLWLRQGMPPARGVDAPATSKPVCGCGPRVTLKLAASGDFGYSLGGAESARDKGVDIRVWHRDGRAWTLLADLSDRAD
jgi:hypothetical protein